MDEWTVYTAHIEAALAVLRLMQPEDKTLAGHLLDAEQALRKAHSHALKEYAREVPSKFGDINDQMILTADKKIISARLRFVKTWVISSSS